MSNNSVHLAVVVAAYDEASNIQPLTQRLIRVLDGTPIIRSWSLIYVVDGQDGTAQTALPVGQLTYRMESRRMTFT